MSMVREPSPSQIISYLCTVGYEAILHLLTPGRSSYHAESAILFPDQSDPSFKNRIVSKHPNIPHTKVYVPKRPTVNNTINIFKF